MSTIDGKVVWGLKKSTQMNITRYIDTMKRMLSSNIQGDVQYKPLPTNITLYEGPNFGFSRKQHNGEAEHEV